MRLLTGATDGLGLELARIWRARDERSILHGRRPLAELERWLFDSTNYVQADLAAVEGPERVLAFLDARAVEALDLLVLNAAAGWIGRVEEQSPASIRELVEVDLLSAMRLCHMLLPRIRRTRGRIVFISSVAAALPSPHYAVYAALKAAAEGFFRSLRVELSRSVEVQVIRLGAVRTRMHQKSGVDPAAIGWERFPEPKRVARAIDARIASSPRWSTIGLSNQALCAVGRNLPRLVDRVQERRGV